jgi:hypothetical protein
MSDTMPGSVRVRAQNAADAVKNRARDYAERPEVAQKLTAIKRRTKSNQRGVAIAAAALVGVTALVRRKRKSRATKPVSRRRLRRTRG